MILIKQQSLFKATNCIESIIHTWASHAKFVFRLKTFPFVISYFGNVYNRPKYAQSQKGVNGRDFSVVQRFFNPQCNFTILYSLIAFDERVTFWLQRVRSLPCACEYVALFVRRLAYNHYEITHAYNAAKMHAQGSDPSRWSQKVTLSSKAIGE